MFGLKKQISKKDEYTYSEYFYQLIIKYSDITF